MHLLRMGCLVEEEFSYPRKPSGKWPQYVLLFHMWDKGSSANMLAVLLGYPDSPPLLLASLEEEALKSSNTAWDHILLVIADDSE